MKLSKKEESEISEIIAKIEANSGGKIAIHIDDYCKGDPYFKAEKLFRDLELLKHPNQNAFLLYIAKDDKQLALLGDQLITQKLEKEFYNNTLEKLGIDIKQKGLAKGIKNALKALENAYQLT